MRLGWKLLHVQRGPRLHADTAHFSWIFSENDHISIFLLAFVLKITLPVSIAQLCCLLISWELLSVQNQVTVVLSSSPEQQEPLR